MAIKALLKRILPRFVQNKLWDIYYLYLAYSGKYAEKINSVTVELTDICDIRCEVCPVPKLKRAKGMMSLEDFKIILDRLPGSVKVIRMNYAGEPLLNKDAFKIISYAKKKRPDIRVRVSTNGTHLDRFQPREIMDSGLDQLDVCIDGITKEIHEGYRRGSNFEQICEAARKLCRYKAETGASVPRINQVTLLSRQNVEMIPQITEFARTLGFDELHLRYMSISGVASRVGKISRLFRFFSELRPQDFDELKEKYLPSPEYSMYAREKDEYIVKDEVKKCYSFLSPLIYFNGDVGACCHDGEGTTVFGNLVRQDFKTVISRMPSRDIYHKKLPICAYCDLSWVGANWKEIELK